MYSFLLSSYHHQIFPQFPPHFLFWSEWKEKLWRLRLKVGDRFLWCWSISFSIFLLFFYFLLVWDVWWRSVTDPVAGVGCIGCLRERHTEREREREGEREMGHHSCCNKQKVKRGLWSPEEDEKLINYISSYGHGCWSSVPRLAGNCFFPLEV